MIAEALDRFLSGVEADITDAARDATEGLAPDRAVCILDGSQFAPSWRAHSSLELLYQSPENSNGELSEAIDDFFNELEREWTGRNDESMSWHDGSLYVFGSEFDFDRW